MLMLLAALLVGASPEAAESARGLAKLAVLQGTLEVKAGAEGEYKALKVGDEVDGGNTLRSAAGTKAALDFPDGSELRIAENTEVTVESPRKVNLLRGHIFVRAVRGSGKFEVASPNAPVFTDQAAVDLEYTPRVKDGPPASTVIRVLDGVARATTPKFSANIFAGFYTTALGFQLNTNNPLRCASLDTSWVHSLLAERGRADEESSSRAMELVQVLGREAANDPAEESLRVLADLATPELARFVTRSSGSSQSARRATGTRIIAETGTLKSAGSLAGLLAHEDPEVRQIAARGLARLNGGKDLGFKDSYWKGDSREAGQKAWEDWVKQTAK